MIIDGSSLLYRAFFAMPPLKNAMGVPTNAVYGFLNMFLKVHDELKPDYVAVTFDKGRETFRTELYKEYKAQRESAPDDLRPQFSLIKEVLSVVGIHSIEMDGFEGDDIIGSLSKQKGSKDLEVSIITGDRDTLQLVDDYTKVYLTKKGITEMVEVSAKNMKDLYGYGPEKVIEMKALMGDSSDNIPGVPGVGEKTALKFIDAYGSLDGLYASIDEVKGKMKEKLIENKELAYLSKELATIKTDIPCTEDMDHFTMSIHVNEMTSVFERLGLHRLTEKFIALTEESYEGEDNLFAAFEAQSAPLRSDFAVGPLDDSFCDGKEVAITFSVEGSYPFITLKEIFLHNGEGSHYLQGESLNSVNLYNALEKANHIYTMDSKGLYQAFLNDEKELTLFNNESNPRLIDIALLAYLLDPTRSSYGISYLCERFEMPQVHSASIKEELEQTVVALFMMKEKALVAEDAASLMDLYSKIELPLVKTLALMERRGIYVDRELLKEMTERFKKEVEALQKEIYELAGQEFNINSPKQLGVILFEVLQLPVIKKTKTGYSTDAEVLEMLRYDHDIVEKIFDYRGVSKLLSTYLEGLSPLIDKKTGRINTTFNQMVTATGRLSSSNPNLQNIPVRTERGKEIRSIFLPGPGYDLLMSADYSQIELRVLAHLCKDEGLLKAFAEGIDIHRYTAAEVLGKKPEDVTAEERSHAKAVNFGIIYGISDFGLSRDLGITRADAKEYIEKYFARYGSIKGFMDGVIEEARKSGEVRTMLGRVRSLPDINNKNFNRRSFAERTAMNTPIQGSAADIIKLAMNRVEDRLEKEQFKSRLLLQVHDELLLEVVEDERQDVENLLREEMEHVMELEVPLAVDVHDAKNWALVK